MKKEKNGKQRNSDMDELTITYIIIKKIIYESDQHINVLSMCVMLKTTFMK